MKLREFNQAMKAHRFWGEDTIRALRYVLVSGMRPVDAARKVGVSQALITRGMNRLERPVCPRCGQEIGR